MGEFDEPPSIRLVKAAGEARWQEASSLLLDVIEHLVARYELPLFQ
ncbi:MAG: hypothetical protein OIF34_03535 [Porticoccaceae bacterium]|nr:hypothetical protein [Porticoccaceae bacterium]